MTTNNTPKGEERKVVLMGGAAIDGAPIAYVIVLAAVVAVLSFIPIPVSAVLGLGGTFPLSQAVYPLVGFLLGPWAGALAAGVGRVIGVFIAPHTASAGLLSTVVAVVTAWAGGILVQKKRAWLFIIMWIVFLLAFAAYVGGGLNADVNLSLALESTFINWTALVLWLLPTRRLARSWIADENPVKLGAGLALGTWIVNTSSFLVANALFYNLLFRWPAVQWQALIVIAPVEHLFRVAVGTVIGVGVILGVRAIGLVKPAKAGY